ncbi:MAG: hypothetical protein ABIN20_00355 [candidate division WOR-3 bacterium]
MKYYIRIFIKLIKNMLDEDKNIKILVFQREILLKKRREDEIIII